MNHVLRCCGLIVLAGLFGCANRPGREPAPPYNSPNTQPQPSVSSTTDRAPAPKPPAPPIAKPFSEAVADAAKVLIGQLPADMAARVVVIDPLIDGVTGEQNLATQSVEANLRAYVRANQPKLSVEPLTVKSLAAKPLLLVGTFTGLNQEGQTAGQRVMYRICLSLADTGTGRVIAKGTARATTDGVDLTPLAYFRDAPAWANDKVTESYIRSCQGVKPGDPIDPFYSNRLISAASINHAVDAYNAGRYKNALDFYSIAIRAGAGDELRILNGLYLANWKLKRRDAARAVAQRIIDFGLERKRMALKFLFQPGSINFAKDPVFAAANPMWINELASKLDKRPDCVEVLGHASRGSPENGDLGLSQDRAQFVRLQIVQQRAGLDRRISAKGRGAEENLVGNGRTDASDALDRRVVLRVRECGAAT